MSERSASGGEASAASHLNRTDTIVFMGGITALSAVSVDMLLPAVGVVARSFGVEAQRGALLVGIYFIAYGLGQLFWGLFSDAFGRRRALIISLSGFTLASFACALAPSFQFLIVARLLQGLMGGAPVIARAMVRDVSSGRDAARMMTILGAILTIATMFAPVLGSGLLVLFDWRACFAALGLLGAVFLIYTIMKLPETAGARRPERFTLRFLLHSGRFLFATRAFLVPLTVGASIFAGFVSVSSVGAITVESAFGVGPESFGALYAFAALSNTAGALFAGQMLKRFTLRQLGSIAICILGLAVLAHGVLIFVTPSLQVFWGAVCLYVLAFGIILPTSMAAAMEPAADMPGFAGSLMGAMQMAAASMGAALASTLYDGTPRAISMSMAMFGGLAITALLVGRYGFRSKI